MLKPNIIEGKRVLWFKKFKTYSKGQKRILVKEKKQAKDKEYKEKQLIENRRKCEKENHLNIGFGQAGERLHSNIPSFPSLI